MQQRSGQRGIVSWSIISRAGAPQLAQWAAAASWSLTTTCSSSMTSGQSSRIWLRSVLLLDLQRLRHVTVLWTSQRWMKLRLLRSPYWTLNQPASMAGPQNVNRKSAWASHSPESWGPVEQLPPAKVGSLHSTAAVWLSQLMLPVPCCPLLDRYFYYNSSRLSTAPPLLCCSRCTMLSSLSFRALCCWLKLPSPTCKA